MEKLSSFIGKIALGVVVTLLWAYTFYLAIDLMVEPNWGVSVTYAQAFVISFLIGLVGSRNFHLTEDHLESAVERDFYGSWAYKLMGVLVALLSIAGVWVSYWVYLLILYVGG